ncbi:MAG: peptide-methionine (S)-S-oxide reductase MsrA [Bacteroidota bacterium]
MKRIKTFILFFVLGTSLNAQLNLNESGMKEQVATFGSGCFWCTEAIFEEVKGVSDVVSGYSGGDVINPAYREVTTGRTGHAEVVQITYYPEIVSYSELLDIFFKTHDPTTLNRQGADVGTQYRSVIFYHNAEQKRLAETKIDQLNQSAYFKDPIVTSVEELKNFYLAEDYHQDYFKKNPDQAYCSAVIKPKLNKMRKDFSDQIKKMQKE